MEGRQRAGGSVELAGTRMRMVVKMLGVDREESFGTYRHQGKARVQTKSSQRS